MDSHANMHTQTYIHTQAVYMQRELGQTSFKYHVGSKVPQDSILILFNQTILDSFRLIFKK